MIFAQLSISEKDMDSKIFNLGANKESLRTILSGFFEREGTDAE